MSVIFKRKHGNPTKNTDTLPSISVRSKEDKMTQQTRTASGRIPGRSKKRFLDAVRKNWILYLMFLPGAVYLLINNYFPMTGLVVAFKDYSAKRGLWGSNWAGLKNFEFLFATPDAMVITHAGEYKLIKQFDQTRKMMKMANMMPTTLFRTMNARL